eukprot:Platyproteum_vivax@DN7545_c0_g1_i4.p1
MSKLPVVLSFLWAILPQGFLLEEKTGRVIEATVTMKPYELKSFIKSNGAAAHLPHISQLYAGHHNGPPLPQPPAGILSFICPRPPFANGFMPHQGPHPHPHPPHPHPPHGKGGEDDCLQCVRMTNIILSENLYVAFAKSCIDTKCPAFKKMCERLMAMPDVAKGLLMGKHDTPETSAGFCVGAGMCSVKAFWMLEELLVETDPLFHLAHRETRERIQQAQVIAQSKPMAESSQLLASPTPDQCDACVQKWAKHMTCGVIEAVKNACEVDKDAKLFQWWCTWARIHPGLAVGWIVSELHPGAFAYGVCITNGGCQHPGPTKTPPALPIEDIATPELFAQ